MRRQSLLLPILLCPCLGLAQSKKPLPLPPAQPQYKQEPSNSRQNFAFAPIRASSTRYPDQVEPDAAFTIEEIRATREVDLFIPEVRAKDVAWDKATQVTTVALERIGLVATDKTEFNRFPSDLALELRALNLSKHFVLVFRPKDQSVFAAMAKDVELLGDRELGELVCDLRGCAFIIDGKFQFTDSGCQVAMTIDSRVYGNLKDDGKPKTGPGNLVPSEWMDTRKLITRIKDSIPR